MKKIEWLNEHPIIREDIADICADSGIPWDALHNSTILVTGATGLIGSLLVKSLVYRSLISGARIKVMAAVRNLNKAHQIFQSQLKHEGEILSFVNSDINTPIQLSEKIDYIVHTASVTSSEDFVIKPVDTIMTTINGTRNILELARIHQPRSVVFLSTMEVYGKLEKERVTESDSGYLDPLSVRSSYPQSKRLAESLCVAYHSQYGVEAKIIRLTQTFGPGISPVDNRVFAQFARAIQEEKDIVLHTKGGLRRDYLYTADSVKGILTILLLGQSGQAYNLSNPESYTSILEFATMCKNISGKINISFDCDEKAAQKYLNETKITLDNSAINHLNPFPRKNLRDSFTRLLQTYLDNNTP